MFRGSLQKYLNTEYFDCLTEAYDLLIKHHYLYSFEKSIFKAIQTNRCLCFRK